MTTPPAGSDATPAGDPARADPGPWKPRNRLAAETSPYLLQHAENPVDWYPWGDEAFERARAEQRPVLLSVGYSSCHWCHVMAHESFEDAATAALMNEAFVNIKVDREERPDVDSVYMTATQALSGQGGWPMTVFLTPEGQPFYAGTYFPPDDRYGRPGFRSVLEAVRNAWETDRPRLLESAGSITGRLQEALSRRSEGRGTVEDSMPAQAARTLRASFDGAWGGFGSAPKFPAASTLEFLLMHQRRSEGGADAAEGAPSALEMVLLTLRRMAQGGIYDHLGGGFSRYSVDDRWLVPHFEKMLYDNAQLARVYLHGALVASEPVDRTLFERVVRETLGYLEREMLDAEGGWYSAQDADSEGIEGKYFVWTPDEVSAVLGPDDARLFNARYNVTTNGNFEDPHHPEFGRRNVLSTPREGAEVAAELGITPQELETRLTSARARLLDARERRVRPGLDDKVLTSWNGLALAAFAEAGRVLGEPRLLELARRNAEFVRGALWREGALAHSYRAGVAKVDGLLEDYAYYGLGLVELFKASGELEWLNWARELLETLIERFHDPDGGFFDSPRDGEVLILRQKSSFDAATPSGNAAAAQLAFWLGRYFDRPEWESLAEEVASATRDQALQAPSGFGATWQVVELMLAPRWELAIVGAPASRAPLEAEAARRYLPHLVLVPANGGGGLPLLEGRDVAPGTAAAYVCEEMICQFPVATRQALAAQLDVV